MTSDPNPRRHTFDQVALLYDRVRPGYPEALFDDIVTFSRIPPGGRILEVGCGTGKATVPLASRGYRIQCVEPGANLAAVAEQNLAPYPNATLSIVDFETWPLEPGSFDLVAAASSFHWIDPAVRYRKAAQALKPAGAIALFWNLHVQTDRSAAFFAAVQEVYARVAPEMRKRFVGPPYPIDVQTPIKDELDGTHLFGEVTVYRYPWEAVYDAASYTSLLDTYSDHRSLEESTRSRLLGEIAELIDTRFGGRLLKEYLTILYMAHRRNRKEALLAMPAVGDDSDFERLPDRGRDVEL
jgi:SAM-dependent methyltransferase